MPKCKKKSADQRRKEQRERAAERRNGVPAVREIERALDAEARRSARSIAEVREDERVRDAASKRSARCDPEIRSIKRSRDVESKRATRSDPKVRAVKRISDVESKRVTRSDPKVRAVKRISDVQSKRAARSDPKLRANKRIRDVESKRAARNDPEVKANKRIRDAELKRAARLKPEVRAKKRRMDMESKRKSRCIPSIKLIKRAKDSASVGVARLDSNKRKHEAELRRIRAKRVRPSHVDKYEINKKLYFDFIRRAPAFICSCCGQTWYQESTVVVTVDDLLHFVDLDDSKKILWVKQSVHRLCSTCYRYVKKQQIPKLALSNGLDFPEIPMELKILTPLECLLVSLRVPFMTIQAVGSERQLKLRGNVVNVPNDLDVCAESLPRRFNEASVIQLQFMRRMRYKNPYMFEKVRPFHVYKAMMFLMTTELYQKANVVLSHDWSRFQEDETLDFITEPGILELYHANPLVPTLLPVRSPNVAGVDFDGKPIAVNHPICEMPAEYPEAMADVRSQDGGALIQDEIEERQDCVIANGAEETLLMQDVARIVKIAPAEGQIPIPLTHDENAEEMSFPTIYCGTHRNIVAEARISYTDIAKSELRRYDRRCSVARKVLYSFKKSYNEKINQAYHICLRKKTGNTKITAGDIRRPEVLSSILEHDEGYGVFNKVRCTPAYWSLKSKNLVSMVRQLGKCALFFTLSAAETKWSELIVILKQQVDQTIITEEEAKSMDREEIARLIRTDPTTCMRHFEHRFDGFVKYLLKGKDGIFSPYEVEDHFFRLEFQARGSPHIHGLLWLKDAPVFVEGVQNTEENCVVFIDKFISCKRRYDPDYTDLMKYQMHKHTNTCYKKSNKKRICRFGYPRPPLPSSRIFLPLPQDFDKKELANLRETYCLLDTKLTDMGRDFAEEIPFNTFLDNLGLTEQQYVLAIRSSVQRPTVFLKRSTTEIFVNNYNPNIIEAWGANMDIQFVLDTYACARYCAGYITKPDGGLSKLLQAATKEVRLGNMAIRDKLKRFGNVLINGVEISVQEAVAYILGISMMQCSRQVVYINTSPPSERTTMLKNNEQLSLLSEGSEDICSKGLIDHYIQRPKELENLCLANFASNYEFESTNRYSNTGNEVVNFDVSTQERDLLTRNQRYKLQDGSGFVRLRCVTKVVRFRRYSEKSDPVNYYREQIMLFLPWRNESTDLLEKDCKAVYQLQSAIVKINSKFAYFRDDMNEDVISAAMEDQNELEDHLVEESVNNDQRLMPEDTIVEHIDELETRGPRVLHFLPPKLIDEPNYYRLMRSLNDRQRRVVLHVLNQVKTFKAPFHVFLHGGAGVGKSHTINAVVQSMLRWQATLPNTNPEHPSVIVTAPTGKAAFNVFGMTLHCAFKLPPNQSKSIVDLNDGTLNTLRTKFLGVKLIVIDEISMVSSKTLYQVDQRLRQIFSNNNPFGGVSLLVVGHLRQLPPVAGSYVFKASNHSPLGDLVGNPLWDLFKFYELIEIQRQMGQIAFCKALNNMSEGTMDQEDIELITSRQMTPGSQTPVDAIHLFFTNKECDAYNKKVHASMPTEAAISIAYDRIEGCASRTAKHSLLEFAKNLSVSQADGLRHEVSLKVGGTYFITTNIDVQDGLFNGATAKLKKIEYGSNSMGESIPKCVWLDFNNPLIGCASRAKSHHYQISKGIDTNWVRIERVTRNLKKRENDLLAIVRSQIPITAANGITIHKSQGSSLDCVVVNLQKARKNSRELLYVGCSRATNLEGLFIAGLFAPPACARSDPVSHELERLKRNPLEIPMCFFQDLAAGKTKIYFHNVQSFPLHREDLIADLCIQAADYIVLVEPKTMITDNIEMDNFELLHRRDAPSHLSSQGVVLFNRCGIEAEAAASSSMLQFEHSHLTMLNFNLDNVRIWTVYKSPTFSEKHFFAKLETMLDPNYPTIIIGDMNINLQNPATLDRAEILLRRYGYAFRLDPNESTTATGTHIDWCLSNFNCSSSIYETYFSHHKAVCLFW